LVNVAAVIVPLPERKPFAPTVTSGTEIDPETVKYAEEETVKGGAFERVPATQRFVPDVTVRGPVKLDVAPSSSET